jgi:hypothetical protein
MWGIKVNSPLSFTILVLDPVNQGSFEDKRQELVRRHQEAERNCSTKPHNLPILQAANKRELDAFDKRMNEELERHDFQTIIKMDQKVMEQQETMKKAGVPGFFVTSCPFETKIQMYIFQFIQRLSII